MGVDRNMVEFSPSSRLLFLFYFITYVIKITLNVTINRINKHYKVGTILFEEVSFLYY